MAGPYQNGKAFNGRETASLQKRSQRPESIISLATKNKVNRQHDTLAVFHEIGWMRVECATLSKSR